MWYKCYKIFTMSNISRQDLRFINLNSAYLADLIILSNLEQRHQKDSEEMRDLKKEEKPVNKDEPKKDCTIDVIDEVLQCFELEYHMINGIRTKQNLEQA